jgi:TonB family protein
MWIRKLTSLGASLALLGCATTTGERGYARINCLAEADGSVSDCRVVSEHPEGYGFGQAAIEAVSRGRVNAKKAGASRFETTVQFQLTEDGTAQPQ